MRDDFITSKFGSIFSTYTKLNVSFIILTMVMTISKHTFTTLYASINS